MWGRDGEAIDVHMRENRNEIEIETNSNREQGIREKVTIIKLPMEKRRV